MLNRVFREERGPMGRLTTAFLKQIWENLKQKYKVGLFSHHALRPCQLYRFSEQSFLWWREEMRRRDQEAADRDERRDQEAAARDERFLAILERLASK